ncbi:MAG: discoidin domain-containing protein [Planctomycetaceae bacterium]|nr:discoidin domain-containing protein [Planctomycetaceae bacterium]
MKHLKVLVLLMAMTAVIGGCSKSQPANPGSDETAAPAAAETSQPAAQVEEAPASADAQTGDLKPLALVLPRPMFVGTPENLAGIENLEKPLGKPRPPFMAPEGTVNLALNKPVTSSESEPITGDLTMVVDGDKEATDGSVIELGPFKQWVQVDLGAKSDIYAVVVWHYHKTPRVYFDVVVQTSDDPDFVTDVKTVFNNDIDNSLGLGIGQDRHYVETAEGRLMDAKGVQGRYVRLYSQANNQNDYSHYIEVEVYGKPVQ